MIAVIDESAPEDRAGIYYIVAVAVLIDEARAVALLAGVLPKSRKRGFHWSKEGPAARAAMLRLIVEVGAVAHVVVHHPTARRKQEAARRLAMREVVPLAVRDGADEVVIESRSSQEDARDRQTLVELVRELELDLRYRWETKDEPLLWIADALCGVVKEYVLGESLEELEMLQRARVLGDLTYRRSRP